MIKEHEITSEEAGQMTKSHRDSNIYPVIGGSFLKEAIRLIIDQKGCEELRYYHAFDNNGNPTLVLVGVDGNGNDMVNGELAEKSWVCPTPCGDLNILNS